MKQLIQTLCIQLAGLAVSPSEIAAMPADDALALAAFLASSKREDQES